MHVVSFMAAKGGTGRSTAVAALALGMLARGLRVHILNASFALPKETPKDFLGYADQITETPPASLVDWKLAMEDYVTADQLRHTNVSSALELKRYLTTDPGDFDSIIVDCPAIGCFAEHIAYTWSHLTIVPARSCVDARLAHDVFRYRGWIDETGAEPMLGLLVGPLASGSIRESFGTLPVFDTEIPVFPETRDAWIGSPYCVNPDDAPGFTKTFATEVLRFLHVTEGI
ncbi:hypothetical protein SAMN05444398_1044 [Roseovarius pacificus]|uniref:Cellulose biosynthesis protein BcsQ n=1 Tax=Roseovarius pacificus TaxID=337701 RepID=A0A1M7BV70_9RHOB|nr:hypothetical protein [Roseovarius pacificus]GGO56130.1 hypothetical protein GCM10011315_20250 [Roseovarius pacificus]SHL58938.1 hypothetical protein SAMN05444398_1044 [Roseovarius pacificus]